MTEDPLTRLAERLLAGGMGVEEFAREARAAMVAPVGDATVDLDRVRRCGFPEVVYSPGKTDDALARIVAALLASGVEALCTRTTPEQAAFLMQRFPQGRYHAAGRTFRAPPAGVELAAAVRLPRAKGVARKPHPQGEVVVVSAGTSDLPVAEEAKETIQWMGCAVELWPDLGVAGPQRLAARVADFAGADAVVVVAGMEGALPSVVAGYVDCPVVAVPTSVGYGANLGGISALLSMLNSCAANVAVVNIDAGFKGGYLAGMIAKRAAQARGAQE